jgi:glycosyltransferase involved in cell wall biosynthesis
LCLEKGVARVVDAAIGMRNADLDINLRMGGSCSDATAKLAISRAERELGSRFEYWGPVSEADRFGFYEGLDYFLFPSSYRNEAQPLVLFEAMASGVACIAGRIGCIADQVGERGGLACALEDFERECIRFVTATCGDKAALRRNAEWQYKYFVDRHDVQVGKFKEELRSILSI